MRNSKWKWSSKYNFVISLLKFKFFITFHQNLLWLKFILVPSSLNYLVIDWKIKNMFKSNYKIKSTYQHVLFVQRSTLKLSKILIKFFLKNLNSLNEGTFLWIRSNLNLNYQKPLKNGHNFIIFTFLSTNFI